MQPLPPQTSIESFNEYLAAPSGRQILSVRHHVTPQYGRVEVEEMYEPGDEYDETVANSRVRSVSITATPRWRTVFVGEPVQSSREYEAWLNLMQKPSKQKQGSD